MSAFKEQVGGDHYKKYAIQPMEYNIKNGIPFAEGEVISYVTRWRDKGGVQDLRKARHVLDMLIEITSAETVYEGREDESAYTKAYEDMVVRGMGVMKDGKHISLSDLMIMAATKTGTGSGDK